MIPEMESLRSKFQIGETRERNPLHAGKQHACFAVRIGWGRPNEEVVLPNKKPALSHSEQDFYRQLVEALVGKALFQDRILVKVAGEQGSRSFLREFLPI